MMGYFEFKAEVYFDEKYYIEKGVTYADSYSSAAAYIEDYYGDELERFSIQAIEPYNVYILDGPTRFETDFFEEKL